MNSYDIPGKDLLEKSIQDLIEIEYLQDIHPYQLTLEELQRILTPINGHRYNKHLLILAAELLCISPAAYRMLRRSEAIILPRERTIRELMSKSLSESNLEKLLETLKHQQRLVNILFDEVKLKQCMRFCGAHVVGHAENNESNDIATSALVTEIICHYGGPRYIMQIIPVSHLKAPELKDILLETASTVKENGGMLISFICDNCPLNQGTYMHLGGLGRAYLPALETHVYLVYDFVHIFKNLSNNWS